MILEYVDYCFVGPRTRWEYSFNICTFRLSLEIWVKLYSQHYVQELLLIPILFLEITVHSNTFIENTNMFHNILTIQTDTIHSSYQRHFSNHEGNIVEAHVKW